MRQEARNLSISLIYQDSKDLSQNIYLPILFPYYQQFLIFLEIQEFCFFQRVLVFSRISLEEKDFTINHHLFQRKLEILFNFVEETKQIFHLFIQFLLLKFRLKAVRVLLYSTRLPFHPFLFFYFSIRMQPSLQITATSQRHVPSISRKQSPIEV